MKTAIADLNATNSALSSDFQSCEDKNYILNRNQNETDIFFSKKDEEDNIAGDVLNKNLLTAIFDWEKDSLFDKNNFSLIDQGIIIRLILDLSVCLKIHLKKIILMLKIKIILLT